MAFFSSLHCNLAPISAFCPSQASHSMCTNFCISHFANCSFPINYWSCSLYTLFSVLHMPSYLPPHNNILFSHFLPPDIPLALSFHLKAQFQHYLIMISILPNLSVELSPTLLHTPCDNSDDIGDNDHNSRDHNCTYHLRGFSNSRNCKPLYDSDRYNSDTKNSSTCNNYNGTMSTCSSSSGVRDSLL